MQPETADRRYAPPQAHVEDVVVEQDETALAGRGARLVAVVIDLLILSVEMGLLSAVTPFDPLSDKNAGTWTSLLINTVVSSTLFIVVQGYFLATRAQTLGKMAMKIRIARPDGTAASIGRIVGLRYGVSVLINLVPFLGLIWGLIDCLSIFRQSRRCLHDNIADTVVLKG